MIICRTPYRVSFFGGGTDFPAWYEHHGGAVLACAINRYCYLTCRYLPPFFKHRHRIVYSIVEEVSALDDIRHPAVRECMRHLGFTDGMEIHHDGDLPKQSGLGTSSSFAVGLLHALHALRGEMRTPLQLAQEAIHVERGLCGENVGSQDQVTAACGGFNWVTFAPGDIITVRPVTLSAARLREFQDHLMLFFTGFPRYSSEVAAEQIRNIPDRASELETLQAMVPEGIRILAENRPLADFGALLDEAWRIKRRLSARVTTSEVDAMYETARRAGALGGKLCGAGGGGFMLLFVEPDRQAHVRQALRDFLYVPFQIDWLGSQIILFQPNEVAS